MSVTRKTELPSNIIRKQTIIESYYNPLHPKLQKVYRGLWFQHFKPKQPKTWNNRLSVNPNLEDLALIAYFLCAKGDYIETLIQYFEPTFYGNIDGNVEKYPTYRDFLTLINNEENTIQIPSDSVLFPPFNTAVSY